MAPCVGVPALTASGGKSMAACFSEFPRSSPSSTSTTGSRLHRHFGRVRLFPCGSRNATFRTAIWSTQRLRCKDDPRNYARRVHRVIFAQNDGEAGRGEGREIRQESAGEFEGEVVGCARIAAASTDEPRVPILVKWSGFLLNKNYFLSAAVLHAPGWCRSSAIVVGLFLFLGVRAAAGVQNPGLPKHSSVVARVSSIGDNTVASSASGGSGSWNTADSLLKREGPHEQVDAKENTASSDGKDAAASTKENRKTSSSETSSRIDSPDERGRDTEPMDDYDDEFDEDYEDEDDEFDELDETFIDVDNVERVQRTSTNTLEPQRKAKGKDTNTTTEGVSTERIGPNSKLKEEKEMERAFKEWRATPYKLTVPLRVVGLRGSVPAVWLKDFILSQGRRAKTKVEYQGSLREIMSALATSLQKKQIKPRSILAADVVTIGDSWLRLAVSGGMIEPIKDAEHHDWFKRLGPNWQALLRRDDEGRPDSQGLIWGAPYRWGSMVIAYRKDKLAKINIPGIKDWKDLWRPELAGKIAMVDSPREVVGVVLKSLGASYNAQDFDKDVYGGKEAVKQKFLALQKQVRLFDSVMYLKALASGDVWVAIGWSSDVIPVAKRLSNITVVAPESGMSLWADLWAIPAATSIPSDKVGARVRGASPLIHQWFDFCLQPARASPFRQGVLVGASPLHLCEEGIHTDIAVTGDQKDVTSTSEICAPNEDTGRTLAGGLTGQGPKFDTNLTEGMPPKDILAKSEFLEPLSEKAVADYEWLFLKTMEQECRPNGIWQTIKLFLQGSFGRSSQRGG